MHAADDVQVNTQAVQRPLEGSQPISPWVMAWVMATESSAFVPQLPSPAVVPPQSAGFSRGDDLEAGMLVR